MKGFIGGSSLSSSCSPFAGHAEGALNPPAHSTMMVCNRQLSGTSILPYSYS